MKVKDLQNWLEVDSDREEQSPRRGEGSFLDALGSPSEVGPLSPLVGRQASLLGTRGQDTNRSELLATMHAEIGARVEKPLPQTRMPRSGSSGMDLSEFSDISKIETTDGKSLYSAVEETKDAGTFATARKEDRSVGGSVESVTADSLDVTDWAEKASATHKDNQNVGARPKKVVMVDQGPFPKFVEPKEPEYEVHRDHIDDRGDLALRGLRKTMTHALRQAKPHGNKLTKDELMLFLEKIGILDERNRSQTGHTLLLNKCHQVAGALFEKDAPLGKKTKSRVAKDDVTNSHHKHVTDVTTEQAETLVLLIKGFKSPEDVEIHLSATTAADVSSAPRDHTEYSGGLGEAEEPMRGASFLEGLQNEYNATLRELMSDFRTRSLMARQGVRYTTHRPYSIIPREKSASHGHVKKVTAGSERTKELSLPNRHRVRRAQERLAEKEKEDLDQCTFKPEFFTKKGKDRGSDGHEDNSGAGTSLGVTGNGQRQGSVSPRSRQQRQGDDRRSRSRDKDRVIFTSTITSSIAPLADAPPPRFTTITTAAAAASASSGGRGTVQQQSAPELDETMWLPVEFPERIEGKTRTGLYLEGRGFVVDELPRIGDPLFIFNPAHPPSFGSGVYKHYPGISESVDGDAFSDATDTVPVAPAMPWGRKGPRSPQGRRRLFHSSPTQSTFPPYRDPTVAHVLPPANDTAGNKANPEKNTTGDRESQGGGWEAVLHEMRERRLLRGTSNGLQSVRKKSPTKRKVGRLNALLTAKRRHHHKRGNVSLDSSSSVSAVMDELGDRLKAMRTTVKNRGDRPDLSLSDQSGGSSAYSPSPNHGTPHSHSINPAFTHTSRLSSSAGTTPLRADEVPSSPISRVKAAGIGATTSPALGSIPAAPPLPAEWPPRKHISSSAGAGAGRGGSQDRRFLFERYIGLRGKTPPRSALGGASASARIGDEKAAPSPAHPSSPPVPGAGAAVVASEVPTTVKKAVEDGELELLPEIRPLPVGFYMPLAALSAHGGSSTGQEEEQVPVGSILRLGTVDSALLQAMVVNKKREEENSALTRIERERQVQRHRQQHQQHTMTVPSSSSSSVSAIARFRPSSSSSPKRPREREVSESKGEGAGYDADGFTHPGGLAGDKHDDIMTAPSTKKVRTRHPPPRPRSRSPSKSAKERHAEDLARSKKAYAARQARMEKEKLHSQLRYYPAGTKPTRGTIKTGGINIKPTVPGPLGHFAAPTRESMSLHPEDAQLRERVSKQHTEEYSAAHSHSASHMPVFSSHSDSHVQDLLKASRALEHHHEDKGGKEREKEKDMEGNGEEKKGEGRPSFTKVLSTAKDKVPKSAAAVFPPVQQPSLFPPVTEEGDADSDVSTVQHEEEKEKEAGNVQVVGTAALGGNKIEECNSPASASAPVRAPVTTLNTSTMSAASTIQTTGTGTATKAEPFNLSPRRILDRPPPPTSESLALCAKVDLMTGVNVNNAWHDLGGHQDNISTEYQWRARHAQERAASALTAGQGHHTDSEVTASEDEGGKRCASRRLQGRSSVESIDEGCGLGWPVPGGSLADSDQGNHLANQYFAHTLRNYSDSHPGSSTSVTLGAISEEKRGRAGRRGARDNMEQQKKREKETTRAQAPHFSRLNDRKREARRLRREKGEHSHQTRSQQEQEVERRELHRRAKEAARERGVAYNPSNRGNYAFREVDRYRAQQNAIGTPLYTSAYDRAAAGGSSPSLVHGSPPASTSARTAHGHALSTSSHVKSGEEVRTIVNRLYYGCDDPKAPVAPPPESPKEVPVSGIPEPEPESEVSSSENESEVNEWWTSSDTPDDSEEGEEEPPLEADEHGYYLDLRHDDLAKRRADKEKRRRKRERKREKEAREKEREHTYEGFEESKKRTKDLIDSLRGLADRSKSPPRSRRSMYSFPGFEGKDQQRDKVSATSPSSPLSAGGAGGGGGARGGSVSPPRSEIFTQKFQSLPRKRNSVVLDSGEEVHLNEYDTAKATYSFGQK